MIPMAVRGRWVQDEHGELHEEKPKQPHADVVAKETAIEREKRERDERDEHPGVYL